MDEFLCVQVLSDAGETDSDFSTRLDDFWDLLHFQLGTALFAKAARLEDIENRRVQSYLVVRPMAALIEKELGIAGFELLPVDTTVVYEQYEAVQPEWIIVNHPDADPDGETPHR